MSKQKDPWICIYKSNGEIVHRENRGAGLPEPEGLLLKTPDGKRWRVGASWKIMRTRQLHTALIPLDEAATDGSLAVYLQHHMSPTLLARLLVQLVGHPGIARAAAQGIVEQYARRTAVE